MIILDLYSQCTVIWETSEQYLNGKFYLKGHDISNTVSHVLGYLWVLYYYHDDNYCFDTGKNCEPWCSPDDQTIVHSECSHQ